MLARLARPLLLLLVVAGYLGVTRTGWLHDDWVFLADAADVAARPNQPVRYLGYQAYWSLLHPLFGLAQWPYALTRLLLHAATALPLMALVRRAGLSRDAALLAGLAYAAAPIVFESVYWGTGAIELLGVFFAVASLERWTAGTSRARTAACLLAAAAIASKEAGLFLPFAYLVWLWREDRRPTPLFLGVVALATFALLEAWWVHGDLAPVDTYALDPAAVPRNLAALGGLLVAPLPLQTTDWIARPLVPLLGAALWGTWLAAGLALRRRGRPVALLALAWALLAVAPVSVTNDHILPRYALAGLAPLVLTGAVLFLRRVERVGAPALLVLAGLLAGLAWTTVSYHTETRHPQGRPVNRLVLKEQFSRAICSSLEKIVTPRDRRIVFVVSDATRPTERTTLQESVADDLALRLLFPQVESVIWVDADAPIPGGSVIVDVNRMSMRLRGRS